MKKRGFIDGFSLIAFIVVTIGIVGATIAYLSPDDINDYSYVGDSKNREYHSISCLNEVPIENRILFQNKELAEDNNYTYKKCNQDGR